MVLCVSIQHPEKCILFECSKKTVRVQVFVIQVRLTLIPKVSVIHSRLWDFVVSRCASAYAQSLCENTNQLYFGGVGLWYWHSPLALDRQYF